MINFTSNNLINSNVKETLQTELDAHIKQLCYLCSKYNPNYKESLFISFFDFLAIPNEHRGSSIRNAISEIDAYADTKRKLEHIEFKKKHIDENNEKAKNLKEIFLRELDNVAISEEDTLDIDTIFAMIEMKYYLLGHLHAEFPPRVNSDNTFRRIP
ncbi:hypothetical protein CN918_28560 [Priestia megaterium]|nr:hypothetical protein CN918_28560 [Priestia megaterium]